jgi:3-hydroxyisobutyrate dehydrogenase
MRIAVLGTGIMGAPIAENIAKAGHQVVVWNRTREKAERVEGAEIADEPAACARGADVVLTMLADGAAVEEVMDSETLGSFGPETLWLQMSTVGIEAIERLAVLARAAGITMVDCPVLGTKKPAEDAMLTALAAGPREARDRADQVFDAIAQRTFWLGDEPGEGTRMKVVINNWVIGLTEVLAESLALARELAVDQSKVLEVLDGNPVGSPYAQIKGRMMVSESFEPSFPLALALKDARLVLEAADVPVTRVVAEQMAHAVELGHGDSDMAATYWASIQRIGRAHA